MRVLFIINPTAGAGRAGVRWQSFLPRLRQAGIQVDHRFTQFPGDAARLAQQATADHRLLVAVGGDGTASEVADGILRAKSNSTALAVMPFGTGNDFAATLGIRSEVQAMESLLSAKSSSIDVIEIQCRSNQQKLLRHALLFAGTGIIGETLKQTNGRVKRLFGQRLSYPVGLAMALWSYRCPSMRIQCDDRNYDGRFLFVGASNTEIAGGGMKLAPGARIDDGLLNVNVVSAVGRFDAFKQLRRVCRGQHITHPQVRYVPARAVEIETDEPLEVAADGDLIGHTPARIEVRQKALRVLLA